MDGLYLLLTWASRVTGKGVAAETRGDTRWSGARGEAGGGGYVQIVHAVPQLQHLHRHAHGGLLGIAPGVHYSACVIANTAAGVRIPRVAGAVLEAKLGERRAAVGGHHVLNEQRYHDYVVQ